MIIDLTLLPVAVCVVTVFLYILVGKARKRTVAILGGGLTIVSILTWPFLPTITF